jgi:primosomal protein N' (replication factor Y) (superfamily II helicase)
MAYPPFSAMANILVRSEKQEQALRMANDLSRFLVPPPEKMKITGPVEAPVLRLKAGFRYQIVIKSQSRKALSELLHRIRKYALETKWPATALIIDVDPMTLM